MVPEPELPDTRIQLPDTGMPDAGIRIGNARIPTFPQVEAPSFELFRRDRYEWSRQAAPWVGVQILLFGAPAVQLMWPPAGKMLQDAVMKWLPESGRTIVRNAIRDLPYE